jgi:hypothetical protein
MIDPDVTSALAISDRDRRLDDTRWASGSISNMCHLRQLIGYGHQGSIPPTCGAVWHPLNKIFMRRNSLRSPRNFMFPLINAIGRFNREVSIQQNTAVSRRWITSPGCSSTPSPEGESKIAGLFLCNLNLPWMPRQSVLKRSKYEYLPNTVPAYS